MPFSRMLEGWAASRDLSSSTASAVVSFWVSSLVSLVSSLDALPLLSFVSVWFLTSQQLVTVEIEVMHYHLRACLSLVVLVRMDLVERVRLLVFLAVLVRAIAILFRLCSLR